MDDEPRLDASRPSNLRLAGFALTVGGALLLGIASVLDWVAVGFTQMPNSQTTDIGTEVGAGRIALGAAVLLLILVVAGRMVADRWRTVISIAMIVIAGLATAVAAWFAISAADHYSPVDDDRLVAALAQAFHKTPDEIRAGLTNVVNQLGGYTHLGPGPWLAIAGGILAIVGGVLTLRWARRLRTNEGAGEPASSAEPLPE
jgi:tryptophan-associated transmembrane protein